MIWLTVILCACWISDLILKYKGRFRFTKPLLMPCIAVLYLYLAADAGRTPRMLETAALAAGWFGDVFLMSEKRRFFMAGLCAFMAGHFFYVLLFLGIGVPDLNLKTAAAFFLYAVYAVLIFFRMRSRVERRMRIPVLCYITIILSMSLLAGLLHGKVPDIPWMLLWGGSLLFVLSDTLVAAERFLGTSGRGVMETYVPAQFLIMLGIAFLP